MITGMKYIYRELDYSNIKSVDDLALWSEKSFGVELDEVFLHVGKNKHSYLICEINIPQKSKDISEIMEGDNGWKYPLGFHLFREFGVEIRFTDKKFSL
ncbi:hypothetical protein [Psychromonas sp. Urea-02u-13]|uniref:hypothetical protein n=1 Tax=Psychromonas sp. Urea-02u-13 TaxID=2058326 RepID=UPI000C34FD23|nr:hypothetical protein [Psychromonas sp. Urea-02u-13]PKG37024.1 hypothetical protein CXF74_21070 [Psychromonas sp. Urea-02u-13]